MPRLLDALQHVRSLVPARALPGIVERRAEKLWAIDDFRQGYLDAMEFMVGETERAPEIPVLARGLLEHSIQRSYQRYRPRLISKQEVRGLEWLTTRRDTSRPAVLSFMHHNRFDGMFASLKRHGVEMEILSTKDALLPDAPKILRQHMRVVGRGGHIFWTTGGSAAVIEAMKPGVIMAIASDVPGQTPVTFLNRKVLGSFGAARIASVADAPVIVITAHREGEGSYLQVHEPLEPKDFDDPTELLGAMLAIHEKAILAWPEAVDMPLARWGTVGEA